MRKKSASLSIMSSLAFILIGCSFSALLGALVGGISGLMPGMHPNSLASLFMAFPQMLALFVMISSPFESVPIAAQILFGCFLIGVLMSHSMTEMIPTSMMGIADDDSISVLLPVQKLFAMGRADLIIDCVMIGSFGAFMVFTISIIPVRLLMGPPGDFYNLLEPYLGFFLIAISLAVLLSEFQPRRILNACLLFLLSGIFGIFVITFELPAQLNSLLFPDKFDVDSSIFFLPAFSGFFALPSLLLSKNESSISRGLQCSANPVFSKSKAVMRSGLPMILVGWIPGITNSYATSLSRKESSQRLRGLDSICSYIVTYSATNIGGSLQSVIALGTMFRARNGILESIKDEFSFEQILWADFSELPIILLSLIWASAISIIVGSVLFTFLSHRILETRDALYFRKLRVPILLFIFLLCVLTSGPIGLIVMFTCFLIALFALKMRTPRVHLMGFLLVPVILYFIFERH